jgi:hypothetical protein
LTMYYADVEAEKQLHESFIWQRER